MPFKQTFENIVAKEEIAHDDHCCRFLVCGKGLKKSSQLLNMIFIWNTDVRKPGNKWVGELAEFWKHCDKKINCSWWTMSPFATMFSTVFSNYYYTQIYRDTLLCFLSRCFQSRLLQACCMCERVKTCLHIKMVWNMRHVAGCVNIRLPSSL